jgi:hypothetical protein
LPTVSGSRAVVSIVFTTRETAGDEVLHIVEMIANVERDELRRAPRLLPVRHSDLPELDERTDRHAAREPIAQLLESRVRQELLVEIDAH